MLQFDILKVQGTQSVTLHTHSQAIPADFTRCEVRLLRNKSFKNNFFTPVVSTNHVLLLFPNSCVPVVSGSNSSVAASTSPATTRDALAADGVAAGCYVTCEAQACIGHFLSHIESIPFRIAYAAACSFSGCAVVVLECLDMEDVLSVQQLCADVSRQGNDERTSSVYVKSFTCGSGAPVSVDAELLATHYFIPTCPLCGDRLEGTVSGYPPQTPLCTCAREGNAHQCTCFLSSTCLVCRRFADSLEQARQPRDAQQPSSQQQQQLQAQSPSVAAIKCEACAKAGDPWICLICGYVGCSRYQAMHAKDHCVAHQHFFSMNLLTQQIWDYDGDCFVHRVVILLDTHTGSSTRMQFPGREDPLLDEGNGGDDHPASAANVPDTSEAWKAEKKSISAKYDKKLISSHTQYAMVIKSELDAKRALYESQLIGEGGTEDGADAVVEEEGRDPFTSEEFEREAYFDLAKAFEPVDSVIADVGVRRRKVTMMFYGVKNLEHELDMRAEETGRLEKQLESVKKELRSVIQQNVANDLRLSSSIHDLKETLQDIAVNAETQRRFAALLGDNQVSRMVVAGGRDAPSGGKASSSASGNRTKAAKSNSKKPDK
ncbi:hypothetical protein ABL78_6062 [Leptomonas seymouri]|uniref:UBP-type domain-containing protein n=1 Tax=Leptomonas seymouri TaxID=5684 RepID=A0A0N1PAV0_LEPSE|nr:hypothetical protein ABL78_6062 [Leptomonas seymouri]|eukprot:KPI84880.1 hypothetical protein ABL78_6062 [Leptomonas seymouri]